MKKLVLFSGLLFFAFSIKAQNKIRFLDEVFTTAPKVTTNVTYGSNQDFAGNNVNLQLDIYEPANDTMMMRPLIVMSHEGSFLFGAKNDDYMVKFAKKMVRRGYVVACITYRKGWTPNLAGSAEDNSRLILPAAWRAVQDYKAAIRFFRKDAATTKVYKIDPSRIAGGGFGAGAYLAINAELIDVSNEFQLGSMRQKDSQGNPTNTPYIDTTKADLGGIQDTKSGSPGYSWRVPVTLIYSGAIIDTMLQNAGKNPMAIACHGDKDETTPYKTAIVNAQLAPGQLTPIIKVHGTYQITRTLDNLGVNKKFNLVDQDKFPQFDIKDNKLGPLNMYKKGVYTFLNQTYMPWDSLQDGYEQSSKFYMDTLVRYTAPRLAYAFGLVKLSDVGTDTVTGVFGNARLDNEVDIFPNPSNGKVFIDLNNFKSNDEINVKVYNSLGQAVLVKNYFGNSIQEMDMSDFEKGIYVLNINTSDKFLSKKVIIN